MSKLTQHLDEVNESYFEHCCHALSFALTLLWGAVVCLIHAFLPFLFERRGSSLVSQLHERMVVNRHRLGKRTRRQDRQQAGA